MLSYRTVSLAQTGKCSRIEEFTTSVTGFNNKFINDIVPQSPYIPQPEAMDYRQHPH
jgi:hypothetical protein